MDWLLLDQSWSICQGSLNPCLNQRTCLDLRSRRGMAREHRRRRRRKTVDWSWRIAARDKATCFFSSSLTHASRLLLKLLSLSLPLFFLVTTRTSLEYNTLPSCFLSRCACAWFRPEKCGWCHVFIWQNGETVRISLGSIGLLETLQRGLHRWFCAQIFQLRSHCGLHNAYATTASYNIQIQYIQYFNTL